MFKSRGWKAAIFVFVAILLENLAFLSVGLNLFTYAFNKMHFSLTASANIVTNFMGTSFLLALLGGIISDVWLRRFTTIVTCGLLQILGLILLTTSAAFFNPPKCQEFTSACHEPTKLQKAVLFGGLYSLALAAGCIKSNLAPMGAEQFNLDDPEEKKELGTYFNTYYFSMTVGTLVTLTAMVYIQENVSFQVGYGITLGCVVLVLLIVCVGYPFYQHNKHSLSSPIVSFAQVFVAAIRNRKLPPVSPEKLHEDIGETCKIGHTDQFRFLDKAATRGPKTADEYPTSWRLCTVTQVEEVKAILKILPIFASTIVLNTTIAQVSTVTIQQGRTMDRKVTSSFEIPPASLGAIPVLCMILALPIYDRVLVPLTRNITGHQSGITHLQRIGCGLVLSTISMVTAALVEKKRLNVATRHNLLDKPGVTVPLGIQWLLLQYFMLGFSEVFTFVGLMEFFFRESPERFRSMSTSLTFVSLSMGYFLSSTLVDLVQDITARHGQLGWLPNNINKGKLTDYYWLMAIISSVNLAIFLVCARWYRYRNA